MVSEGVHLYNWDICIKKKEEEVQNWKNWDWSSSVFKLKAYKISVGNYDKIA